MDDESIIFTDKVLIEKVLRGNTQAFAIVVKNTERLVAQIVRKMVDNEEDQRDLVQNIYLKAYQNLSSFKFQCKLSTWIGTIAYNQTINFLEKKKIKYKDFDDLHENTFVNFENIEKEIFKNETKVMLQIEIKKLPPLYQTLISLYHLEELPNKEIAQITNLPEGTIKNYLSRARKILKDNLERNHKFSEYGN